MTRYKFRLYVVGDGPVSRLAAKKLRAALAGIGPFSLETLDILKHPEAAERDKVIAAPTVIRLQPLPMMRAIGDLSGGDSLLAALGVTAV